MELYHEIREKVFILILSGNLDGYNAGEIAQMLKKAIKSQKETILVDCRNLLTVSTAGLGIFLANLPLMKENNINLLFFGMSAGVRKVFTFLGLDAILSILDQEPEEMHEVAHS